MSELSKTQLNLILNNLERENKELRQKLEAAEDEVKEIEVDLNNVRESEKRARDHAEGLRRSSADRMKINNDLLIEINKLKSVIRDAREQKPKWYKEKGTLEIISASEYRELLSIGSIMQEEFEPVFAAPVPAMPVQDNVESENTHEWIIEKLSYHKYEREDLTIDDCLKYLATEWSEVSGRTTRQMVMQILALLASSKSEVKPSC